MSNSRWNLLRLTVAILSLGSVGGCGKGTKAGPPLFPTRVNLTPSSNTSVNLGATFSFTASAQTTAGTNLATTFTYTSSDTSVLNVAPNGVACAGHWDVAFTTCTPGGTGVVTVTASALNQSSVPTFVFVHPVIDSITVTGILLTGVPIQEPCLSQGQSMTLEAHAFSQGSDITAAVGPFTWSAQFPTVVNLVGIVNTAYNFPTTPAHGGRPDSWNGGHGNSASGVSSSSLPAAAHQNLRSHFSKVLDFFETCPIQTINLEVGAAGSQVTSQTTFVAAKGSSQTATAILTDVMGKSSLPNSNNDIVLSKIPLTWTSSQPASGGAPRPLASQNLRPFTTPLPGAGSVTASCSPPTCNIGYPFVPTTLSRRRPPSRPAPSSSQNGAAFSRPQQLPATDTGSGVHLSFSDSPLDLASGNEQSRA